MALDNHYTNSKLAALYDLDSPWGSDTDFYIQLIGRDKLSVADLGCGTGTLCFGLLSAGHKVTGIDPANAMLDVAKGKHGADRVIWVNSTAGEFRLNSTVDVVTMTGHAFQVFELDDDIRDAFSNVARHLEVGGRIAFESRNPELDWAQIWARDFVWHTEFGDVLQTRSGFSRSGEFIRFRHTYQFPNETHVSDSVLRFASRGTIEALLLEAGFEIVSVFGDWSAGDLTSDSKEMIFVAQKK